jgi:hypothetical protein
MLQVFTLILILFYPSGKVEREMRPVSVPECQLVDGKRVEDSSCGVKACMKIGRERAAEIWGVIPGMKFGLMCKAEGQEAHEGTGAGGGHPALHFE